ncbi:MAG: MoaD/ThiS family protein [Hadesarchaea archaeon]|nr:MoaD/ThiS family protein [Hadesarchaea archaeon]
MKIKIKNGTNLSELRLKREWEEEIPEGSTVGDLLSKLNLNKLKNDDGTLSTLVLTFKNGKSIKNANEELSDGDKIKLVPTASGG